LASAILGYIKNTENLRSIEIKVEEFINISKSLGYEICDIVSQYETKLKSAYLFGKERLRKLRKRQ